MQDRLQEISEWLETEGWKIFPINFRPPLFKDQSWYKIVDAKPLCKANQDLDGIQVMLTAHDIDNCLSRDFISFDLTLVGQPDDEFWVDLKVYSSIDSNNIKEVLQAQVDKLIRMWQAAQSNSIGTIENIKQSVRKNFISLHIDGQNENGTHLLICPPNNLILPELVYDELLDSQDPDVERIYKEAIQLGFYDNCAIVVICDVGKYNPDYGIPYRLSHIDIELTNLFFGTPEEQKRNFYLKVK